MSCRADMVTTAGPEQASTIANFVVPATDNCPPPAGAIADKPASGPAFLVGTTKVTGTATDSGGDKASCGFNVTVKAPTATDVKSIAGQHGNPVTLTASVSPTPLAEQTATGTVDFFVTGDLVGSSPLDASGVAVRSFTNVLRAG